MAFEPFPSKRNDPAWDDFAEWHSPAKSSHDLARNVSAAQPSMVPPGIDVQAMIKLVEQAQTVQSAVLAPEQTKLPWWAKHDVAKTTYWTVLVPTLVSGCANISAHQWGTTGPAVTGGLVSMGATALGVVGLNHNWRSQGLAVMLAGAVGGAAWAAAASGGGWTEVMAWLASASATLGFKLIWNRKHAESKAKVCLTEAKVRTELAKGDAVKSKSAITDALGLMRLQEAQRAATAAATPVFQCATPEERALRCAVWDTFQVELYSCNVRHTRTGYVATVGLPVALARNAATAGWDKVSSALRADGRFVVTNGRLSNELDVKFLDNAKVSTEPMPWDVSVMPDDRAGLMSIGIDTETGDPVHVQFDERLLVCGASGTGKSWSTRPLLAHALINGDMVMIDGKGEEANVWMNVCRVAIEQEEIEDLIDAVHAEMNARKAVMAARGISVWDGPQLTVFVDENQVVLSVISKDAARMQRYRELSSLGRSRGVVLWIATQKPTMSGAAPGIDSQMAGNFLNRFSLRVAGEQEARTALDDCAYYEPNKIAEGREWRGHGYWKGYGPSLIRTWTMDDDAVRRLPASIWRGQSEESLGVRARRFLEANPDASQRAVAAGLGVPESTLRKALKGA